MTEYFKQIVDAWGDRLRSPVLGSILIFFVATNWQSLFYLFFADKPVRARLLYFDANTDGWSLYGIPVIGGVFLAIAVPWISLAGAFLAKFPRAILHSVQSSEAQKRRVLDYELKAKEEEARGAFDEARERRKIDAAKRLDEAEDMSAELKSEIESDRKAHDTVPQLSDAAILILDFASASENGRFTLDKGKLRCRTNENGFIEQDFGETHKERKLLENTLNSLVKNGLLKLTKPFGGNNHYEITVDGYSAIEAFREQ
jgi:hypothetical protein